MIFSYVGSLPRICHNIKQARHFWTATDTLWTCCGHFGIQRAAPLGCASTLCHKLVIVLDENPTSLMGHTLCYEHLTSHSFLCLPRYNWPLVKTIDRGYPIVVIIAINPCQPTKCCIPVTDVHRTGYVLASHGRRQKTTCDKRIH